MTKVNEIEHEAVNENEGFLTDAGQIVRKDENSLSVFSLRLLDSALGSRNGALAAYQTTRACQLQSDQTLKKLGIERCEVNELFTVSSSLAHAHPFKCAHGFSLVSVSLPIGVDQIPKILDLWLKDLDYSRCEIKDHLRGCLKIFHYSTRKTCSTVFAILPLNASSEEIEAKQLEIEKTTNNRCSDCGYFLDSRNLGTQEQFWIDYKAPGFKLEALECLTENGFSKVVTQFVNYSMPKTMLLIHQLSKTLRSSDYEKLVSKLEGTET